MLPRVFLDEMGEVGKDLIIGGEDGHHFARVLRVQPGEPIVLALTNGPWLGAISDVGSKDITVRLNEPYRPAEPKTLVTIVQGLAKGDKMETIVQKCTELGAHMFVVYEADRSVVRLQGKVDNKLGRWQKVAREAAMQSQRDRVPCVQYERNLNSLCQELIREGVTHFVVLDEAEQATGIAASLRSIGDKTNHRALFIGPEGGWSERERALLLEFDETSLVTLGPRILRTETAGSAGLAVTLAHFGDMGG
ncbi:RsmE family RNA methyltransferase [Alicyclobacillus dauci]|uniref:Ribosomal RNA small subunit methyltransferase E n=1 Tax=Alicyclobacillus dauci TaxID=1475485 RepID=A0ABY6Z8Y8_9BACL|nr:16S rRNA (uracil(1498)-N(3))-methyltransferase [Alicyclobacillus dauci]WAH38540.1 16S rRNA (uracil(1498)-N(3))-methyltransferase [Alicyclobacillus dauci]